MGADFASTGRSSMPAIHPKPNSDWEKQRAVRTVAHHATDVDDFRDLLEMLGLKAKDGKVSQTQKPTPFNKRVRG
jgi:hypothetical protein